MILPLWGQDCIVTYNGERVLAQARSPFINPDGRYFLNVYSPKWGYDRIFPAGEILLLDIMLPGGVKYDADAAFHAKYSAEQIDAMIAAESAVKPVPRPVLPVARAKHAKTNAAVSLESKAAMDVIARPRELQSIAPTVKRVVRGRRG